MTTNAEEARKRRGTTFHVHGQKTPSEKAMCSGHKHPDIQVEPGWKLIDEKKLKSNQSQLTTPLHLQPKNKKHTHTWRHCHKRLNVCQHTASVLFPPTKAIQKIKQVIYLHKTVSLLMSDNKMPKFHGIWESSVWEAFKEASPFPAIWCH